MYNTLEGYHVFPPQIQDCNFLCSAKTLVFVSFCVIPFGTHMLKFKTVYYFVSAPTQKMSVHVNVSTRRAPQHVLMVLVASQQECATAKWDRAMISTATAPEPDN